MDWISCKLASQVVDFCECKISLVQCALQARRLNWRCQLWVLPRAGCVAWVCPLSLMNYSFSVKQRCWTREEDFFQLWQSWIYIWNHLLGSFNRRSAESDLVVCLRSFFLFPSSSPANTTSQWWPDRTLQGTCGLGPDFDKSWVKRKRSKNSLLTWPLNIKNRSSCYPVAGVLRLCRMSQSLRRN